MAWHGRVVDHDSVDYPNETTRHAIVAAHAQSRTSPAHSLGDPCRTAVLGLGCCRCRYCCFAIAEAVSLYACCCRYREFELAAKLLVSAVSCIAVGAPGTKTNSDHQKSPVLHRKRFSCCPVSCGIVGVCWGTMRYDTCRIVSCRVVLIRCMLVVLFFVLILVCAVPQTQRNIVCCPPIHIPVLVPTPTPITCRCGAVRYSKRQGLLLPYGTIHLFMLCSTPHHTTLNQTNALFVPCPERNATLFVVYRFTSSCPYPMTCRYGIVSHRTVHQR